MSAPEGPYTVEHRRPVAPDEDGSPFCAACSHYHEGACLCPDCGRPTPCRDHGHDRSVSTPATTVVSRWAYATLEEAHMIVESMTDHRDDWRELRRSIAALPESGGTIKLPGSEIVVEAVDEERMRDDLRRLPLPSNAPAGSLTGTWVAAWNAEYGIGERA